MLNQKTTLKTAILLMLLTAMPSIPVSAQVNVLLNPRPQYASNSCRAYALALAAGTLPGTPIPIGTVAELRAAEKDLQTRLESVAKRSGPGQTAGSHEVWQKAIGEMTSGQLEAVVEYAKDLATFTKRILDITGNGAADKLGAVFSSLLVKTPVLTSVTKIAKSSYTSGHIIAVYGTGSGNGHKPLAVLNPAVKVANTNRLACQIDDVPNDEKWSAIVSIEPEYELKRFRQGYLVMSIRRK